MKKAGVLGVILACSLMSGCASLMSNAASGLADNLTTAILNHDDPETARAGMPSYMLLMDSFVEGSPDDPAMLGAASTLYASYAGVFASDDVRASRLSNRARNYAADAMCYSYAESCEWNQLKFRDFESSLNSVDATYAEALYDYGFALLVYIQAHSDDQSALAELPHAEAIMVRYLTLSGDAARASAYVYLGMLQTVLPPAYGGRPEAARENFEKAIELTDGKDLSAKVAFAESYAKLMFDRELHDKLVDEVLAASPYADGLTLTNVLAQEDALRLKQQADRYF